MSIDKDRIESLLSLKEPSNRDECRQILGLFNYVRRYVPHMANIMSPLFKLLKKNTEFSWLPAHRLAFAELKQRVCMAPPLTPFDPKAETVLQCDASKNGLGCCLFQNYKVRFNRTMNETELNYSQTGKELLAIYFAVKKFHRYIFGSRVEVQTDHKPIVSIMLKPICMIGSTRLKTLRLKLVVFSLNVSYLLGKLLCFADMLSRQSLKVNENCKVLDMVHSVSVHLPLSSERKLNFQSDNKSDPVLSLLYKYYCIGWPEFSKVPIECRNYYNFKENIYFEEGLAF